MIDEALAQTGYFVWRKKEGTIQYGYRTWGTHARVFSPNTRAWEQQVWKGAKRARKNEAPTAYHILIKIQ